MQRVQLNLISMITVFRDDYGYDLPIDTGIDLTGATTLELLAKPRFGGSVKTITCTQDTTTKITASITQDFFDRLGKWDCQAKITFPAGPRYGAKFEVWVAQNNA